MKIRKQITAIFEIAQDECPSFFLSILSATEELGWRSDTPYQHSKLVSESIGRAEDVFMVSIACASENFSDLKNMAGPWVKEDLAVQFVPHNMGEGVYISVLVWIKEEGSDFYSLVCLPSELSIHQKSLIDDFINLITV